MHIFALKLIKFLNICLYESKNNDDGCGTDDGDCSKWRKDDGEYQSSEGYSNS